MVLETTILGTGYPNLSATFFKLNQKPCSYQDNSAAWTWTRSSSVWHHGIRNHDLRHRIPKLVSNFLYEFVDVNFLGGQGVFAACYVVFCEDFLRFSAVNFPSFGQYFFINFLLYCHQLLRRSLFKIIKRVKSAHGQVIFEKVNSGIVLGNCPIASSRNDFVRIENKYKLNGY